MMKYKQKTIAIPSKNNAWKEREKKRKAIEELFALNAKKIGIIHFDYTLQNSKQSTNSHYKLIESFSHNVDTVLHKIKSGYKI